METRIEQLPYTRPKIFKMEGRPFHTRLHSLDALRGFDMFWIISGEGIFHGLSAATDHPAANWISDQLHHSSWNGFTFYDMIFPLFIFIAGIAMPLSYERILDGKNQKEKKLARTKMYVSLGRSCYNLYPGRYHPGLFPDQYHYNL